ncbi:MAG: hypothetical protein ACTSU5_09090 [Promethearchaeota archaeon]
MDKKKQKIVVLVVHGAIIVHFLVEIAYCGIQVFVFLRPEGAGAGPLFGAAQTIDMDLFLKRRLYAIETWVATGGLAIYLAITEIAPRLRAVREVLT